MLEEIPTVDVVGVGLNAADTIIRLPYFPAFNSKVEFQDAAVLLGGQVATAITACATWGLKTRYVGKIGDDSFGRLQQEAMARAGIEAHWRVAKNCESQSSFILVDRKTGERTVLWKRDRRLELVPEDLERPWVTRAKLLHVDGHDCAAAATVARWARSAEIPVTADLDNLYPGVEALLENVDFMISSREFPAQLTKELDLFVSLPRISSKFGCKIAAATLGEDGVLAWNGSQFHYSPAFELKPVDTTGAGDIFHAAFAYSQLGGGALQKQLEFCCASAGLACMAAGARGGIAALDEIEWLIKHGSRRPDAFSSEQLVSATKAVA